MKALRGNGRGEFILIKLKAYGQQYSIAIKYTTPYLHKENGLAKKGQKILIIMKDSLLIDSNLSHNFWAKTMETANYLQNCLPTKTESYRELISEEKCSNKRENVSHISIFGSEVLGNIPQEKKKKSDYQHVWKKILIGFNSNITKHYQTWAPETKQVFIVSNPYIDESIQRAKLLVKWPLDFPKMK